MKRTGVAYDPPELADAAWSGWAEWARQWLLLNRREKFDPDSNGEHKLWFAVGGSAGHSGLWGLDIEEGRRDAPEGRYWDVSVRPASDVRAEAKDDRQAERRREKAAKFEKDLDAVAEALDAYPDGATRTRLREHCGMSGDEVWHGHRRAGETRNRGTVRSASQQPQDTKGRISTCARYRRQPNMNHSDHPDRAVGQQVVRVLRAPVGQQHYVVVLSVRVVLARTIARVWRLSGWSLSEWWNRHPVARRPQRSLPNQ